LLLTRETLKSALESSHITRFISSAILYINRFISAARLYSPATMRPPLCVASRSALLLLLLLLAPAARAQPLPRYPPQHSHACLPPNDATKFAFCDTTLPVQDRVQDLISRLSLAEKIANRYDLEPANDALGLPEFNYNQEGRA